MAAEDYLPWGEGWYPGEMEPDTVRTPRAKSRESIYKSFCPIPGATKKEQHMKIEIENAEVTRAYCNSRTSAKGETFTDYILNLKFEEVSNPGTQWERVSENFISVKTRKEEVFNGIKEGDIIEKLKASYFGHAWNGKDGEVVFADFNVFRREDITLKAAVAKKPILACDWKAAQLAFIEAKGLGDSSADEIKKAFGEFCKATIPGKAAKDYKPVDWATIHNAATGAREETPEEEAAPDFGSDPDNLPF